MRENIDKGHESTIEFSLYTLQLGLGSLTCIDSAI